MTKENSFSRIMESKSDSELKNYIENKKQFQDAAIAAAIWELEKRAKIEGSEQVVDAEFEKKKVAEIERIEKVANESKVYDDPNAPILYHTKFVMFYGVFFSVFAGAILMAMNFARLDKKKTAWLVVLAGFVFSVIQGVILNLIPIRVTGLALVFCFLGMYLLDTMFWKKQVSNELKYRKRSIWEPIIIGLLFWTPIIYTIFTTGGM